MQTTIRRIWFLSVVYESVLRQFISIKQSRSKGREGMDAKTRPSLQPVEKVCQKADFFDRLTAVGRVSRGINALALKAMSLGRGQAHDPHADGFAELPINLNKADREVRERLNKCLDAI